MADDGSGSRRTSRTDDDERQAPPVVVAAVALGTAPLPFLAVYSVLFLVHGTVHPVHPPDITSSKTGEAIAGLITLALFVVLIVALLWFLNGRRRWPFLVLELALLVTAIDLFLDSTVSGPVLCLLLAAAALAAIVLAVLPESWTHVGRPVPAVLRRSREPSTERPKHAVDG